MDFCAQHNLKIITVADLIRYRLRTERFVRKVGETTLPTPHGNFRMFVFESILDQQTHVALVRGNIEHGEDVLVRVQTHCLTGHAFGSPACHCHEQMDCAMGMIAEAGRGVLLYLHEMGRGRAGAALLEYHGKHGADSNETIVLDGPAARIRRCRCCSLRSVADLHYDTSVPRIRG